MTISEWLVGIAVWALTALVFGLFAYSTLLFGRRGWSKFFWVLCLAVFIGRQALIWQADFGAGSLLRLKENLIFQTALKDSLTLMLIAVPLTLSGAWFIWERELYPCVRRAAHRYQRKQRQKEADDND